MREIKFRGKAKHNNNWYFGYLNYSQSRKEYYILEDFASFPAPIFENTIGECTGLIDKNGNEIYEGDILKYTFDNPGSVVATENGLKVRIDKVFWSEWRSSFALGSKGCNNDLFTYVRNGNRVEVIGNIYDNPELLKGEIYV